MYKNSRTAMRVKGVRSECKCWCTSGVDKFSLFAVALNDITKDVRDGFLKKIFYTDDVLLGDCWKRWGKGFSHGRKVLKKKG